MASAVLAVLTVFMAVTRLGPVTAELAEAAVGGVALDVGCTVVVNVTVAARLAALEVTVTPSR